MKSAITKKQYAAEHQSLKDQIEQKNGKSTEQLYAERAQRVKDVIELRVPDRVPYSINVNMQTYTGVPNSAAYYDPMVYKTGIRRITVDLEPDMCNAGLPTSGVALEVLDAKNKLWPGGPIPPNYEYQFVEGEFMKEDEYDMFINDPSGFMIRRYLPRVYGTMLPLQKLPPLDSLMMGFEGMTPLFASEDFIEMARKMVKAGQALAKFRKTIGDAYEELAELGFPPMGTVGATGAGGAPFDTLSSFLRGMKGSMVDMYRRPDKLLKACELILDRRIAVATPATPNKRGGLNKIGVPLWRGDKAFMSDAQFKKFYWPGLKRALQASIDLGFIPIPFFEAEFGDRLEHLLELPAGKVVASVEYVDAVKAKQILGGHTALLVRGGPLSSAIWPLNEVESCIKDLIDKCGKDGGLLLNIRLPDKVKSNEGRAMLQRIRKYGRY
ncbi:MAG TPA: hypothetical protein VLH15_05225 [Dehalococcoidales bacterium]|nr:hypothetical protein [Dehalococcoidales bacterium]